jgi:patatin-like phospholipase
MPGRGLRASCAVAFVVLGSAAAADVPAAPPLGLTISGSVSLGAYEAGFLHYLLETLRANPGTREVRLITGSSGGSANGVLAIMQHCGTAPPSTAEGPLWQSWIPLGIDRLRQGEPASPLAAFSRQSLREQAARIEQAWQEGLRETCDVVLGMSVTRVEPRQVRLGVDGIVLPRIDEQFAIRVRGRGAGRPARITNYVDPSWPGEQLLLPEDERGEVAFSDLRDLLFASTAFPAAFEPQPLSHCVATARNGAAPHCSPAQAKTALFIDGGLLDNWPLRSAVRLARAGLRDGEGDGGSRWLDVPDLDAGDLPATLLLTYLSTNVIAYPEEEPHKPARESSAMLDHLPRLAAAFFDAARAQSLLSFVQEEPALGQQVAVPVRQWPAASSPLGAFFGFFETEFRRFDFTLGMYEARRMLVDGSRLRPLAALPEHETPQDPAWRQLACMRAVLDRAGDAHDACRGEDLRDFRILLQASIERLWDRCARMDGDATPTHGGCRAARSGAPLPAVPEVRQLERWKSRPEDTQIQYVMRLLVQHGFLFGDHGLQRSRSKEAPAVLRRELIAIGRSVARQQPVGDAIALETLVGLTADGLVYVPPRETAWLAVGRDLELGWSLGLLDGFEEVRWLRLHLALQLNGWSRLVSSDPSVTAASLLGGVELIPPRMSSMRFQFGLLARGGMLFTSRDRLGTASCPSPESTEVGRCTRPAFEAGLVGVVAERIRLHLVGAWYPRWGAGTKPLWSIAPAAGLQLVF